MKYALPSPRGTNVERLYSDAAWLAPRGGAYDAKGGLRRATLGYDRQPRRAMDTAEDPVHRIYAWVVANLDQDAQGRLMELLAAKPAAQDDEPDVDPYDTRAKLPENAYGKTPKPGMDSKHFLDPVTARLDRKFPGFGSIGFA